MSEMKSMNNARPLGNEPCIVLTYNGSWKWFENAYCKYEADGKYTWIDADTNEEIQRVIEWKYK